MNRILIAGIIFICCIKICNSQEISVYGLRSLWHADDLCDIDFTGCDWRLIDRGYMLGYAYHPNGNLLLVLNEQIDDGYNLINIFNVKIEECQYDLLYSIPLPRYWRCSNAINIDYLGALYLNVNEYDTIINKSTRTLSKISNPAQPVIERMFVFFPGQQIFEVHFSGNKIYIPEVNKEFLYVFDNNFNLLETRIMPKHIWGLTSFSYDCDSVITYSAHMGITTEELNAGIDDSTMYISKYDLEANTLTPVCSYWMGDKAAVTMLTSPLEFLSSDPECDLLIDLDRDNSSGVYPYDYLDSNKYCIQFEAPICDEDVYIHSSVDLDSIRLTLSGIKNAGDEHLTVQSPPAGINFIVKNDSTYLITSFNPSDSLYREALLSLRYQHQGLSRSAGQRSILVQGFNDIKVGVKVTAFINVEASPYAGEDRSLIICIDTIISSFSTITNGQTGGHWQPNLISGGDEFNSSNDQASIYKYIIDDPKCGTDTAEVIIFRDNTSILDLLGPDRTLCYGDTVFLDAGLTELEIIWDDDSFENTRELTVPGSYWLTVRTPEGCTYHDSINIIEGKVWNGELEYVNPICGEENGRIQIDSLAFIESFFMEFDGKELKSPVISSLSSGIYSINALSLDGCEYEGLVTLINEESIKVALDTLIDVYEQEWIKVNYVLLNNIDPFDVIFNPEMDIFWSGYDIHVFGKTDITYTITFTDENGCVDVHPLKVKVEKLKGIFIPNIFRPGSTVGNHVWRIFLGPQYELEVLRIYDRWGNLIYQSTLAGEWNGNFGSGPSPAGVYVYQLILTDRMNHEQKKLRGEISLIR